MSQVRSGVDVLSVTVHGMVDRCTYIWGLEAERFHWFAASGLSSFLLYRFTQRWWNFKGLLGILGGLRLARGRSI